MIADTMEGNTDSISAGNGGIRIACCLIPIIQTYTVISYHSTSTDRQAFTALWRLDLGATFHRWRCRVRLRRSCLSFSSSSLLQTKKKVADAKQRQLRPQPSILLGYLHIICIVYSTAHSPYVDVHRRTVYDWRLSLGGSVDCHASQWNGTRMGYVDA